MKNSFLPHKNFVIQTPDTIDVVHRKLVAEIKTPIPLAWGKNPEAFLRSIRKCLYQSSVNCNSFSGKVSKNNFRIYNYVNGRRLSTAYGKYKETSTGTTIYITVDNTFGLVVDFLVVIITFLSYLSSRTPTLSRISIISNYELSFLAAGLLFVFLYNIKNFQGELDFYKIRLIEIFLNRNK
jgi:hypothetical protein